MQITEYDDCAKGLVTGNSNRKTVFFNLYMQQRPLKPQLISTKIEEFSHSIAPAGSVWSNVDDILKYLLLELNTTKLFMDYIDMENLLSRRKKGIEIAYQQNYGLGLFVENYKGLEIIHHGGNTMGFSSDMFFIPNKNIGAVILTNTGGAHILPIREKLLELLFGIDTKVEAFFASNKKEIERTVKKIKDSIKPSIHKIETFEGVYRSKNLGKLSIYMENGKLYADFGEFITQLAEIKTPGPSRVFLPVSPPWSWTGRFQMIKDGNNFILPAAQEKYVFKRDSE